ncbi:MAG: Uma2 family endonuclease [Acidobacteria bacterium]|nr:Uma2 family endonuclease [Acidobacteriota bacterium]
MTVTEYEKLPPPKDGWLELHHGEPVKVTRPRLVHTLQQRRLGQLLEKRLGQFGVVIVECPFRPTPEHEIWAADVALIAHSRLDAQDEEAWLAGAPDVVIEVLSPSNTASELLDKELLCLRSGSLEFWIVDRKLKLVRVSRRNGSATVYEEADQIPLDSLGGGMLAVSEIFRR